MINTSIRPNYEIRAVSGGFAVYQQSPWCVAYPDYQRIGSSPQEEADAYQALLNYKTIADRHFGIEK